MRWPGIESLYGENLRRSKVFGPKGTQGVPGDIEEADEGSQGTKRWEVLHDRVVEHVREIVNLLALRALKLLCSPLAGPQNIRTISKYYTRITINRLSQLLDLTPPKTELFLSSLVSSKTVYAKIDRPAGVVSFLKPKTGDEVLNEWSSDVGKLMGLIEKSCHLIAKVRLGSARWCCSRAYSADTAPLLHSQEHAVHSALKAQGLRA